MKKNEEGLYNGSHQRKESNIMEKMIAFCGIICTECPAYLATQNNDEIKRKEVAAQWSSDKYPLKPEDVNCYGCLATDKDLMAFCADCKVRQCGQQKKVKNCAYCEEYICDKLNKLWTIIGEHSKQAKAMLEDIRKKDKA